MPDVFTDKKKAVESHSVHSKKKPVKKFKSTKQDIKNRLLNKHPYIASKNHNPLSSFSYIPREVEFVNEDPEEVVVLLLRKHPITNLKWIIMAIAMLFIPSFVFILPTIDRLPGNYQLALTLVWYLITTAFVIEEFLSWFFHVNIVTDERIIDVNFHHLIYREITDAKIDQIRQMDALDALGQNDLHPKVHGAQSGVFTAGALSIRFSGKNHVGNALRLQL